MLLFRSAFWHAFQRARRRDGRTARSADPGKINTEVLTPAKSADTECDRRMVQFIVTYVNGGGVRFCVCSTSRSNGSVRGRNRSVAVVRLQSFPFLVARRRQCIAHRRHIPDWRQRRLARGSGMRARRPAGVGRREQTQHPVRVSIEIALERQ